MNRSQTRNAKINYKLIIVVLFALAVLAVTAVGLRKFNRSNRAKQGLTKGLEAYEQNQWSLAATELGRYLSLNPEDKEILYKYGTAQLNIRPASENNIKQTINAFRRILREDPQYKDTAEKLIEIYSGLNQPAEAELIARQKLEGNSDPELKRLLAESLIQQQNFNEAIEILDGLIKENSSYVPAYKTYADILQQRPQQFPQDPLDYLDKAVENNPQSALAYINRANYYLSQGRRSQAMADLNTASELDLSNVTERISLARAYTNADETEKALGHLQTAYELDTDNFQLYTTWAQLATNSGSAEQMDRIAEMALENLTTERITFFPVAAELYINAGNFQKAQEYIQKLEDIKFSPGTIAFLKGMMEEKRQNWHLAVKNYKDAINLRMSSPQLKLSLAQAYIKIDDITAAMAQLRDLINEHPGFYQGRITLAALLSNQGNWTQAAEQARLAVSLRPTLQATILYITARINLLDNDPQKQDSFVLNTIKSDIDVVIKAVGDSLEAKLLNISFLIKTGQYDQAQTSLEELKQQHPDKPEIVFKQLELLAIQNKQDRFHSLLVSSLQKFPAEMFLTETLAGYYIQKDEFDNALKVIADAQTKADAESDKVKLALLEADAYIISKQYDAASELFKTLLEQYPDQISVLRKILQHSTLTAMTEMSPGIIEKIRELEGPDGRQWRYEQARYWYRTDETQETNTKIINLLRDNLQRFPNDRQSRLLLAATYRRGGNLQLSISTYLEALNRTPDDLNVIIPTISAMFQAGQYERADQILRELELKNIKDPRLAQFEYASHLRSGRLEAAISILKNALEENPEDKNILLALARLQIQQENGQQAETILLDLISENPDFFPASLMMTELYLNNEENEKALQICNRFISDYPNDPRGYLLRAQTYLHIRNIDKVTQDTAKALQIDPENINTLINLIEISQQLNDPQKALEYARNALRIEPENFQVRKLAAVTFLDSDQPQLIEQGRKLLDQALLDNSGDPELALRKAELLLEKNTRASLTEAQQILKNVTQTNPSNPQAWVLLAELQTDLGNPGSAMDTLLRGLSHLPGNIMLLLAKARCEAQVSPAVAINTLKNLYEGYPQNPVVISALANQYLNNNQAQQAVDVLTQSLPALEEVHKYQLQILLARAYIAQGKNDQAREIFTSLNTGENSSDPQTVVAWAFSLIEQKQYEAAANKITEWIEQNPGSAENFLSVATTLASEHTNQAAQKAAENILRIIIAHNPDSASTLQTLGVFLHGQGKTEAAREIYRKVLAMDPQRGVAANNLAWILFEQGSYQEALDIANDTLIRFPDYADLLDTRGMIQLKMGLYSQALDDFTQAINKYRTDSAQLAGTYLHHAMALEKLGRNAQAKQSLQTALKTFEQNGGLDPQQVTEARQMLESL